VNRRSAEPVKAGPREFRGALRDCHACVEDEGTNESIHRELTFRSVPKNLESARYGYLFTALGLSS